MVVVVVGKFTSQGGSGGSDRSSAPILKMQVFGGSQGNGGGMRGLNVSPHHHH